mmetsp:Transcript_762/g.1836  ORF Transcript_762/g.1836 Transcript_762/m.1836 type:complete len:232 (-) Transcript_762:988-1683(-)
MPMPPRRRVLISHCDVPNPFHSTVGGSQVFDSRVIWFPSNVIRPSSDFFRASSFPFSVVKTTNASPEGRISVSIFLSSSSGDWPFSGSPLEEAKVSRASPTPKAPSIIRFSKAFKEVHSEVHSRLKMELLLETSASLSDSSTGRLVFDDDSSCSVSSSSCWNTCFSTPLKSQQTDTPTTFSPEASCKASFMRSSSRMPSGSPSVLASVGSPEATTEKRFGVRKSFLLCTSW